MKKYYLFILTLVLFSVNVLGANCGDGDDNITFASGGTFNVLDDTATCEYSVLDNYINITCGAETQQYFIGSGESWELTECSADCEFLEYGQNIETDFKMCKGTYFGLGDHEVWKDLVFDGNYGTVHSVGTWFCEDKYNTENTVIKNWNLFGNGVNDGIYSFSRTNITVINNNVSNFDEGIIGSWDNSLIENNSIYNFSRYGITITSAANNNTIKNNIINMSSVPTGAGMIIKGQDNNFINNRLYNFNKGFWEQETTSGRNNYTSNKIYNMSSIGFYTNEDSVGYNTYNHNYMYRVRNCLDFNSKNNHVFNDTCINYTHNFIDLNHGEYAPNNYFDSLYGYTNTDGDESTSIAYTTNATNLTIVNSVFNFTNSTVVSFGFQLSLNSSGNIINNTVRNVHSYCLFLAGSFNITNNTFENCNLNETSGDVIIKNNVIKENTLYFNNNNYSANSVDIKIEEDTLKATFNETADLLINLSNGATRYFRYIGRKDITVQNLTVNVFSDIPKPNGSIINETFDTYTYDQNDKKVEFDCTGAAPFTMINLDDIYNNQNLYYIYHDGVYLGSSSNSTYLVDSCSNWLFTGYNVDSITCYNGVNEVISGFNEFAGLFGLIVILILFTVLYKTFNNDINFTPNQLYVGGLTLVVIAVMVAFILTVLSKMSLIC